jgi:hypothetical protein
VSEMRDLPDRHRPGQEPPDHERPDLERLRPRRKRNEDGGVPPNGPVISGPESKRSDSRASTEIELRLKDHP